MYTCRKHYISISRWILYFSVRQTHIYDSHIYVNYSYVIYHFIQTPTLNRLTKLTTNATSVIHMSERHSLFRRQTRLVADVKLLSHSWKERVFTLWTQSISNKLQLHKQVLNIWFLVKGHKMSNNTKRIYLLSSPFSTFHNSLTLFS